MVWRVKDRVFRRLWEAVEYSEVVGHPIYRVEGVEEGEEDDD